MVQTCDLQGLQYIENAGSALVKHLINLFDSTKVGYQTGLPQSNLTALKQEQANAK